VAYSIDISKWPTFINQQGNEWESLHQTSGAAPDLGPAWSLALIAANKISPDTVSVLSATDDRGLALVFPFRLTRSAAFGVGCQLLDPLLNIHCIHNAILSRLPQSQTETLISNFLEDDCDWDILQVNSVVDDSAYAGIWNNLNLRKAPKIIGKGLEAIGDLNINKINNAVRFSSFKTMKKGDDIIFEGTI
jgi:hypothetical protein